MDPQAPFCHNPDCPARGLVGRGHIRIHCRKRRRYRCTICNRTLAATRGAPFDRLETPPETVAAVTALLCHGCPIQAVVAAFGFDGRTVMRRQERAGRHCQDLHEHRVQCGRVDLQHVQADELSVKVVGRRVWMAMAMAVPSRLWLCGVISPRRDSALITALVQRVRSCAVSPAMVVCVEGVARYVSAFVSAFRHPVRTGRPGRPRSEEESGPLIGQVVKHRRQRPAVGVTRRVVRGAADAIAAVLLATGTGTMINTAYSARPNAAFRAASTPLTRRGRAIARGETTPEAGMSPGGCAYNSCWEHESLRQASAEGAGRKWPDRTPAMAAGLTDHRRTMRELLSCQVPLSPRVVPKRHGRPPKQNQPEMPAAA